MVILSRLAAGRLIALAVLLRNIVGRGRLCLSVLVAARGLVIVTLIILLGAFVRLRRRLGSLCIPSVVVLSSRITGLVIFSFFLVTTPGRLRLGRLRLSTLVTIGRLVVLATLLRVLEGWLGMFITMIVLARLIVRRTVVLVVLLRGSVC